MSPLKLYTQQTTWRYDYARRVPRPTSTSLRTGGIAGLSPPLRKNLKPCVSYPKLTTLVTSSKALLTHPERIGIFNLGLHAACGQVPCLVKSKSNAATWRMTLGQPLGYRADLRRKLRSDFNYKWVFLAPASGITMTQHRQVGLRNVFIFALDHHDYALFEPWPGLDLEFRYQRASGLV